MGLEMVKRILIVDDDEVTRWSLAKLLTRAGHIVLEAATGAEASQMALEGSPDFVFLDLRLPDADSLSLLDMIRAFTPGLSVVLMGSHLPREARLRVLRSGALCCLEKPITPVLVTVLLSHGEAAVEPGDQ